MIAYDYASDASDSRYHGKKQIPSFCSQLTAELYFFPQQHMTNINKQVSLDIHCYRTARTSKQQELKI